MNNSTKVSIYNAQQLLRQRKLKPAHYTIKKVLSQQPDNMSALLVYAEILLLSGNLPGAERVIDRMFDMDISCFESREQLSLAGLCFGTESFFKASQLFEILEAKGKAGAQVRYQLGIALSRIGEIDRAEENLAACISLNPGVADVYLQMGHLHKARGNVEEAEQYYKKYIGLSETNKAAGYWYLADLKAYRFTIDEIRAINKQLEVAGKNSIQASSLYFALGKVAEQEKEYDQAFHDYNKGNLIQAALKPFLSDRFGELINELKTISSEQQAGNTENHPTPVFIVGLPRSGSTLIEQILSAHSQVQATDELPFLAKMAWQMGLRGGYAERLRHLSAGEVKALCKQYMNSVKPYLKKETGYFIDKCPGNFLHIGLIKRIMPNAIIIDSRRDPRDNAVSAFRQLFYMGNEFSSSFRSIYQYYKYYLELMDHWQSIYPDQIRLVQYESLVSDPDREIQSLLDFCRLESERTCFEFYNNKRAVMTPSANQVNQPMYTSSIGQWRFYDEFAGDDMLRLGSLLES